jgi:outer membrane protein OmpA-like peptidoglycan-associated protein
MPLTKPIAASLAAVSLVSLSACVTDPNTGERKVSRAAIGGIGGALAGALLGDVIGGSTARILGAGIGGVAGAAIGNQMDNQIRELREQTAGSGIDVSPTDDGRAILVNLPNGITFPVDSSAIQPDFRRTLDDIAGNLNRYPDSLIDVYGHTDASGSDDYNLALSDRRARAVADYLSSRGVNPARIRWQGFGESQPIASNDSEQGRATNRRVEIKIVPVTREQVEDARGR